MRTYFHQSRRIGFSTRSLDDRHLAQGLWGDKEVTRYHGGSWSSQQIAAALTAIAYTERVDIYWTTLIGHLSLAAARTGNMSIEEAMLAVTGIVAAMAIPAYSTVSDSWKGDRLQRDDIREACRGVAQSFENGDTMITEIIGVAIAIRVWPERSEEWHAAVERRRAYEYRKTLWQPLEPVT